MLTVCSASAAVGSSCCRLGRCQGLFEGTHLASRKGPQRLHLEHDLCLWAAPGFPAVQYSPDPSGHTRLHKSHKPVRHRSVGLTQGCPHMCLYHRTMQLRHITQARDTCTSATGESAEMQAAKCVLNLSSQNEVALAEGGLLTVVSSLSQTVYATASGYSLPHAGRCSRGSLAGLPCAQLRADAISLSAHSPLEDVTVLRALEREVSFRRCLLTWSNACPKECVLQRE